MIDKNTKSKLKKLSKVKNKSMSELARKYLYEKVEEENLKLRDSAMSPIDFFDDLVKDAKPGLTGEEYDKYAYDL